MDRNAHQDDGKLIVLGIDPGLAITGYGLLKLENSSCSVLDYGCIRTPARQELPKRLFTVYQEVFSLINCYTPGVMAVEQLFFCKNVRTATQVGEARGAVLTAAASYDIPVIEYTPLQVKLAVAGYGKADKKQVQQMVSLILKLDKPPTPDDTADALAVALCHLQSRCWREKVGLSPKLKLESQKSSSQ